MAIKNTASNDFDQRSSIVKSVFLDGQLFDVRLQKKISHECLLSVYVLVTRHFEKSPAALHT